VTAGPLDDLTTDHGLLRAELLSGQVDLDPGAEAVPVVHPGPLARDVDLAEHQVAAEEVVEHQGGRPALPAGGVVGMPVGAVGWVARVDTPTRPESALHIGESPHNGQNRVRPQTRREAC
jgi:hypothetical protein